MSAYTHPRKNFAYKQLMKPVTKKMRIYWQRDFREFSHNDGSKRKLEYVRKPKQSTEDALQVKRPCKRI